MGGEIGCESMPGQGSLFWFTIPAERAMPAAYQDPQSPGTLSGHVLVVEDNAVNRMLIGAYLDEFGLTYEIVEGGANSITRLTAGKPTTSCSWTSDLDGVETTKRIRKMHGAAAEVPIVALTAHAMKGDRETYLAAGMDGYVSKPIRGRELLAALAPYLSREEERVHPKPTRHGGAVPGSHGSLRALKVVDGRAKPGHSCVGDDRERSRDCPSARRRPGSNRRSAEALGRNW